MKTFRNTRGKFRERPHFEDREIESICLDELRKFNLLPASPAAVNVELFVERSHGVGSPGRLSPGRKIGDDGGALIATLPITPGAAWPPGWWGWRAARCAAAHQAIVAAAASNFLPEPPAGIGVARGLATATGKFRCCNVVAGGWNIEQFRCVV